MYTLHHYRFQHPVGFGSFHSAGISFANWKRPAAFHYNYVVDCGAGRSRIPNILKSEISNLCYNTDKIDALFITHLHNDHISGIDLLLEHFQHVEYIILPYITPVVRLAMIASLIRKNINLADEQFNFLFSPTDWLTKRGAKNIIMIYNDGSPRADNMVEHPVFEYDGEFDEGERLVLTNPTNSELPDYGLFGSERFGGCNNLIAMNCNNPLLIRHRIYSTVWKFDTYVERPNIKDYNSFISELGIAFPNHFPILSGCASQPADINTTLRSLIFNAHSRAKLKVCYEKVFPKNFNRTSLCIASRPVVFKQAVSNFCCFRQVFVDKFHNATYSRSYNELASKKCGILLNNAMKLFRKSFLLLLESLSNDVIFQDFICMLFGTRDHSPFCIRCNRD